MTMLGTRTTRPIARALSAALAVAAGAIATGAAGWAVADVPPLVWRPATQSPRAALADPRLAPQLAACLEIPRRQSGDLIEGGQVRGASDGALVEVASRTARRQIEGGSLLHADELAFHLRASGDPHVWPRAWSITGAGLDDEDVARRIKAWASPWNTLGVRRCGIARVPGSDGNTVIAVVAIDALADLSPLPTLARVGQWLTLDGTMLVPASDA
jgi:hypothetical protein